MCNIGRTTFAVDETGVIWPCIMLRIEAGRLKDNTFSEIWENSEILQKIREMKISDFRSAEKCNDCSILCVGNNYIYSGNIYKNYRYPEILAGWLKEYYDSDNLGINKKEFELYEK